MNEWSVDRWIAVSALAAPFMITAVIFGVRWKWNKEWRREKQVQDVAKLKTAVKELKAPAQRNKPKSVS